MLKKVGFFFFDNGFKNQTYRTSGSLNNNSKSNDNDKYKPSRTMFKTRKCPMTCH